MGRDRAKHIARGRVLGRALAKSFVCALKAWNRQKEERPGMPELHSPVSQSRARSVVCWIVTSILSAECVVGGAMGALRLQPFIGIVGHLGYPPYFMTILGIWYILAGLALLAPRFPLLKEWAYAGLFFNYSGALVSHFAVRDPIKTFIAPVAFACFVVLSWSFRPRDRRLRRRQN